MRLKVTNIASGIMTLSLLLLKASVIEPTRDRINSEMTSVSESLSNEKLRINRAKSDTKVEIRTPADPSTDLFPAEGLLFSSGPRAVDFHLSLPKYTPNIAPNESPMQTDTTPK